MSELMKIFRRERIRRTKRGRLSLHYAKYIGVLSSNKSYPLEEGAYVNIL